MVQCEMCGTETADPNRIKVEGAKLDVCDGCTEFGTELQTGSDESSTSTKYSTSSDSGSGGSSSGRSSSTGSTGASGGGRDDIYEDVDELAQDFDQQIRRARERADLTQAELAQQLNEKASLIRKLERGETLPTDDVQRKLERYFDIDLSAGGSVDTDGWESDSSEGGYTLGDIVERKD